MLKRCLLVCIIIGLWKTTFAENGYNLWLRYQPINDPALASQYSPLLQQLIFPATSPTLTVAKAELTLALHQMLQLNLPNVTSASLPGTLIIGTRQLKTIADAGINDDIKNLGNEGFLIRSLKQNNRQETLITANTDLGILYGVFHFLKLLQTHQNISSLAISEQPRIQRRLLNHWDNLNGTIERGYAGYSIWNWERLPGYLDKRYTDYARANASIGINGTVLNNVNASANSLTREYLQKAAALAAVFRPYGIKVYLTAKFSAPKEIGGLKTIDPLDPAVADWWKKKADEIYNIIPDFGGFLVKANSEGQPGPQDYGRTHVDGANMLASALKPHGGIVMWRTFVYENKKGEDRVKQAYQEFKSFDGRFAENVMIQPKNGPLDFQPREPILPLWGAMPRTPQLMEFQLTQEYLGFATHLVYLAPLLKETLETDTYAKGKGTTVASVVEGKTDGHTMSGMAGVANIGTDLNWCGHPFAQANWYAFGRLAWNPYDSSAGIATDWLKMTFSNDRSFIEPIQQLMMISRETAVDYMMPLGLHHIMKSGSRYGPGPWSKTAETVFHLADTAGIGINRSSTGTNAVAQYFSPLKEEYDQITTCPEKYLLWFHHVPWDYQMRSGRTLWNELVHHYYAGVQAVEKMQATWNNMNGKIDDERFEQVKQLLAVQAKEAAWWRDACVLYFQTHSKQPIPKEYPIPPQPLSYYKSLPYPDFKN